MRTLMKQTSAITLCLLLLVSSVQWEVQAQEKSTSEYSGQGVPLTAEELQQLVAPIALYPDALVAQVLGAATFPDQVAFAADWLKQNSSLKGKSLMDAVDGQQWDPSVKAITQFPSVLDNMAKNLTWTSSLGEAYHTQAAEVMQAVQFLREKAKAAGNLKSSEQIKVVQQSPQIIVIQPANPQIVYVPTYNPAVIYGTPYVVPGYTTSAAAATGVMAFGAGIAIGAMLASSSPWNYSYWNCNWHSSTVVYRSSAYYGNSAWHGGYYGSGGAAYGPNGAAHYNRGYNPSTGTYARGATVSNGYGSEHVGQAYNPRTGAYGTTHQGSNAYGSWGSSTASKNGNTAYGQHQTTAAGTTGSVQTSNGGKAAGASGQYNSAAAGKTANGNKYATADGKAYSNTGSGWQQKGGTSDDALKSGSSGWGQAEKSGGSSAFGGGASGWQSRAESARGSASRGGGGGWGGGHSFGGFHGRR